MAQEVRGQRGRRRRREAGPKGGAVGLRLVFMGTPMYAVPVLRALVQLPRVDAVLVITRPAAARGRGRQPALPPVAEAARQLGLPVWTPSRLGPQAAARLARWRPDVALTAAYGVILPPAVLAQFPAGAYNLHASLLPRWRGPNPIAWAIRSGDAETGVSLMRMDAGVDTGPVAAQVRVPVAPDDTTGTLTARLAEAAARLWTEQWPALSSGVLQAVPQAGPACHAPKDPPGAGRLHFEAPADVLARMIRSMLPDPGPHTMAGPVRIKVLQARVAEWAVAGVPGTIVRRAPGAEEWVVACGRQTALQIQLIQPAGRRPMSPGAFDRGQSAPPTMLS